MFKKGFTLVETMVYMAVVAMVFGIFANIVLSVNKSYSRLGTVRNLDIATITSMERITRAIRSSTSADVSAPGVLTLTQVDSDGISSRVKFQIVNSNIQIQIDDVDQGTLLPDEVTASNLSFNLIDSGRSRAVKMEVQLLDQKYYSTVILRGTYK